MADPSKYPTRLPPYGLRIPPELKARIEASAKANNRTLHAEILITLEGAYPAPNNGPLDVVMLSEYMALIESASTEEERDRLLIAVNDALLKEPSTSAVEIRLGFDPDGQPALYVSRRKG